MTIHTAPAAVAADPNAIIEPAAWDSSAYWSNRRLRAAVGVETFIDLMTIELYGHDQCGTSFDCEVEFSVIKGRAPYEDDAGEDDEVTVISVRPYDHAILPTGFKSTIPRYLKVPHWLEEILIDCVDTDKLDWRQS